MKGGMDADRAFQESSEGGKKGRTNGESKGGKERQGKEDGETERKRKRKGKMKRYAMNRC